jgi:hypothetical protein|tara:strand:+ start:2465 stop:2653 length:189 start_codon:yes stop_codon:yes gene_type:complete
MADPANPHAGCARDFPCGLLNLCLNDNRTYPEKLFKNNGLKKHLAYENKICTLILIATPPTL